MRDLSLHVLDLVQNSVKAHATLIQVSVSLDPQADLLTIRIDDDGDGMSPDFLQQVTSPFTTTRTTRKVGLGIPMMKINAELTGGGLEISSTPGQGTSLVARFGLSHIDRPPLGDLAGTMLSLALMAEDHLDYLLHLSRPDAEFTFDTREIRQALGDVPLSTPDVIEWMKESLEEGIAPFDC